MISLLLFVIGCYIFVATAAHVYFRCYQHQSPEKHFILLSEQPKEQLESILHSMYSFSRWMGVPVKVSVVSTSPCPELSYMANHWNNKYFPVHIVAPEGMSQYAIIVDLNKEQDLRKLPF